VTDPRLLIVETSARRGAVAVAHGDRLLGVHLLDEARRNARDLAPGIAELLRGQGWAAKQLDAVVVSLGPGSYTGLRVGVMSAKALAYAAGCALLGVETFAAVALQSPAECGRVDVIGDAQKEDVYVQSFARGEGWRAAGELRIEPFARWLEQRDSGAWVSGPGLAKWEAKLPPGVPWAPPEAREPRVESLLILGLARYRAEERDDPFALEPLYLRASSAERQWRGRGP
jgi:tRNA threonylcarbamoyladenosine biosynthesis protein TsaB